MKRHVRSTPDEPRAHARPRAAKATVSVGCGEPGIHSEGSASPDARRVGGSGVGEAVGELVLVIVVTGDPVVGGEVELPLEQAPANRKSAAIARSVCLCMITRTLRRSISHGPQEIRG